MTTLLRKWQFYWESDNFIEKATLCKLSWGSLNGPLKPESESDRIVEDNVVFLSLKVFNYDKFSNVYKVTFLEF